MEKMNASGKKQLLSILEDNIRVLKTGNAMEWAASLNRAKETFELGISERDEQTLIRNLLGIFAGMGSFNDIVLQKDGKILYEENERFEKTRTELFQCLIDLLK